MNEMLTRSVTDSSSSQNTIHVSETKMSNGKIMLNKTCPGRRATSILTSSWETTLLTPSR